MTDELNRLIEQASATLTRLCEIADRMEARLERLDQISKPNAKCAGTDASEKTL
jgi:hypothetical protein